MTWARFRDWWTKGECLFQHAEPVHERNPETGKPEWRCPHCMATWPKTVGLKWQRIAE